MSAYSRAAFDDLATGGWWTLYRFALVLTSSPTDAEDLVQEALMRLAMQWQRSDIQNPEAYARKALFNLHTSRWRRLRREVLTANDIPERAAAPPESTLEIWAELQRLPLRQLAAVFLRYYYDMPEIEVAAVMKCSVGTVKSQTSRGLDKLRQVVAASPANAGRE